MADPVTTSALELVYGDDEFLEGTVTDADGNAVDLTAAGVELTFTLAKDFTGTTALTKTIGSGVTGNADGTYEVHIEDTDTSSFDEKAVYKFDLVLTDASAQLTTVARGTIEFEGSVKA